MYSLKVEYLLSPSVSRDKLHGHFGADGQLDPIENSRTNGIALPKVRLLANFDSAEIALALAIFRLKILDPLSLLRYEDRTERELTQTDRRSG